MKHGGTHHAYFTFKQLVSFNITSKLVDVCQSERRFSRSKIVKV